jgi:hypothetical protein
MRTHKMGGVEGERWVMMVKKKKEGAKEEVEGMSPISSHTARGGARSFPVWVLPSSHSVISLADLHG